jgi:pyrroline-5-carboxylate reductase
MPHGLSSVAFPSLAFLGAGSMGGAIVRGLVSSQSVVDGSIFVTNRSASKAAALAELAGVESIALENDPAGNARAAGGARVVVLGVKPYMIAELLDEIVPHLAEDAIIVSLAAGITLAQIEAKTGTRAVVRSMPNTPSTVGRGVAGIAGGAHATAEDVALVRRLFETVGAAVEVDGDDGIDAISTISGSGPAYVFLLVEQFIEAARHQGFDAETARRRSLRRRTPPTPAPRSWPPRAEPHRRPAAPVAQSVVGGRPEQQFARPERGGLAVPAVPVAQFVVPAARKSRLRDRSGEGGAPLAFQRGEALHVLVRARDDDEVVVRHDGARLRVAEGLRG